MLIFSENALAPAIEGVRAGQNVWPLVDGPIQQDVVVTTIDAVQWVVHRSDDETSRLVLVDSGAIGEVVSQRAPLDRALERIERVARGFRSPPVHLPPAWHKYQHDNLIAFFALPRQLNDVSLRWIAEFVDNRDMCFWEVTSRDNEKSLADFSADHGILLKIRAQWPQALRDSQSHLPAEHSGPASLRPTIDLDMVGSSAVSRERPYSLWLDDLTEQQTAVLDYTGVSALKVRGPAGTGKTVVLQLKALHDLYEAVDEGRPAPRILYLTHSWALADSVDRSLGTMDERGLAASSIQVMPLAWLREEFYGDLPEGAEVLGDDSLEGKRAQMALLSEAIDGILETDWVTFSDRVSEAVRAGVEGGAGTAERKTLTWNIMREISEVIDANKLKPGLNSLQRYVDVHREGWMVDLPERADRELVYAVYRTLLRRLQEEGQLTADQALDDFRKYLESYAWGLRRSTEGFDQVLVDEFHLFSDAERYLVHLLTRDPEVPPSLILALDPYQSVFTLLTGLSDDRLSRDDQDVAMVSGEVSEFSLDVVHRFSKEILGLVKLIHESFPNLLDVGDDWVMDMSDAEASRSGKLPSVHVETGAHDAAERALAIAVSRNDASPVGERTALIAAGTQEFEALEPLLTGSAEGLTVVRGRDDLAQLSYARRSIVVTTSEFSAGLQFSHVVVLALASRTAQHGGGSSASRAALSELYLGVTRAEQTVDIVTTGEAGQIGDLLKRATDMGLADRGEA